MLQLVMGLTLDVSAGELDPGLGSTFYIGRYCRVVLGVGWNDFRSIVDAGFLGQC